MVIESRNSTTFVQYQYYSIMQRVAGISDELNIVLSAYFEHGNVSLIPGVLILLSANQAFRDKYIPQYLHQLRLEGFIEHLSDVNAYFINTNLDVLTQH